MATSQFQTGIIAFGIVIFSGCNQGEPERDEVMSTLVSSLEHANLETEADVQAVVSNATRSSRSVMFVHVDWAIMEPQRTRFAAFCLEYQRTHSGDPVLFHYVDCTSVTDGYGPLRALPGWKGLESAAGTSFIHGWGELIWMDRGRVLHVERILNFETSTELVEKTRSLMSAQNGG
jgi:hypothetical protein